MEVVSFPQGTTQAVKDTLSDLMKMVEERNLVGLAFAVVERDGTGGSAFSDTPQASALVGALEFLKLRLMNASH